MKENFQKKGIEREKERTLSKIHCVNRKNIIRNNKFIQEHTLWTPSKYPLIQKFTPRT